MQYISVKEAAARWHIDPSRVGRLAREGRIEGAIISGHGWMIPDDAEKPSDRRIRQAKAESQKVFFRFPLYVNSEEKDFVPPLSKEEATLRRAQKDFYSCEFQRAKDVFETLSEKAENIGVKISAMFFMCVLSAEYNLKIDWKSYYDRMEKLLSEDFPHKQELSLFLPWLEFLFGQHNNVHKKLPCEPMYDLHPSAWYLNAFLSVFFYQEHPVQKTPEPFETLCRLSERDGYYVEAQGLYEALFAAYNYFPDKEPAMYHLRKVIRIAYEHDLLFPVADMKTYYTYEVDSVLAEYPADFAEKIERFSRLIYSNYSRFADVNNISRLYSILSRDDFAFLLYAVKSYTNKEIAEHMKLSERTVVNRYNEIYNKLGVTGKSELVLLFQSSMGGK